MINIDGIRAELINYGKRNAVRGFHADSHTYLFYCMKIGRRGVKGYGNFPEDAYAEFLRNLEMTVEDASLSNLIRYAAETRIYIPKIETSKVESIYDRI